MVLGRVCRGLGAPLIRRTMTHVASAQQTPFSQIRPIAPVFGTAVARTYVTTAKFSRDDVMERLDAFHSEVMSANWGDYLYLVYNVPFWEAELDKLTTIVQPYLYEAEAGAKFKDVQELMDVLYKCEDVRDHLNELAEMCTRASGLMGTGYGAEARIENLDDHAQLCAQAYDKLLTEHPAMKPKIEQTVGHGLAILRQKHKFKWTTMHRYFF